MSGYVDLFFKNTLLYVNAIFDSEFMEYFLSVFVVVSVLGILRKFLRVNK